MVAQATTTGAEGDSVVNPAVAVRHEGKTVGYAPLRERNNAFQAVL
jgi:hypothetical protein